MKIPFDNIENFFSHSAIHFYQLEQQGMSSSRFDYIKRLAAHSKRLKNAQCPSVAVYCKTIRQYGKKGLWIYDQYFQMLIGVRPHAKCHPLDMQVIKNYAEDQYDNPNDIQRFIETREHLCQSL